jgi:uncharacterized protein
LPGPPPPRATIARVAEIAVRLTPRAAKEEIAAAPGGGYAARVTAPPVDGRANEALRRLVAKRAGVAPSRVSVVKGEKARDKVVRVDGLDEVELRERLLG